VEKTDLREDHLNEPFMSSRLLRKVRAARYEANTPLESLEGEFQPAE
jgi:hypothetical protein